MSLQSEINDLEIQKFDPRLVDWSFWLWAIKSKVLSTTYNKETNGKWLLFYKANEIKDWWYKICDEQESGNLVDCCKVSTMKTNPNGEKDYVICVYCDMKNCLEIREKLRNLGVVKKIPFKLDSSTRAKEKKSIHFI